MKKWIALMLCILTLFSSFALAETLPVYQAVRRTQEEANFFDKADPAWFNQSGEPAKANGSKRARYDLFTFPDGAQLNVDTSYIYYNENDGEYCMYYGGDPKDVGGPFPRPSFASEVGQIAARTLYRCEIYGLDEPTADVTLTSLKLEDADKAVQELLARLGLYNYQLTQSIAMTAQRIREWGVAQVEADQNNYNVFDHYYDFSQATEADEGYYLVYTPMLNGLPVGNPDGTEDVRAFINQTGIVSFELRSSYAIGDVYSTPEHLLTQEEIRTCFEGDNERRIQDGFLEPVLTDAVLMYCPMRAPSKQDGMVMAPAWYITYDFLDVTQECDGWAWYSALDGKMIADCYF